jgi:hypothetical protein
MAAVGIYLDDLLYGGYTIIILQVRKGGKTSVLKNDARSLFRLFQPGGQARGLPPRT